MYGDVSRPSYCTGYQSSALFFSNTGSMALRLADVHPPNVVATLSTEISFCAFSAKVGQSDAPSSTLASSFLPRTPPLALISSIAMSSASRTDTSLMAMVPLSECRTPTLIVLPLSVAPDVPPLLELVLDLLPHAAPSSASVATAPTRTRHRLDRKLFSPS